MVTAYLKLHSLLQRKRSHWNLSPRHRLQGSAHAFAGFAQRTLEPTWLALAQLPVPLCILRENTVYGWASPGPPVTPVRRCGNYGGAGPPVTPATWWELRGGHAGPKPLACTSHRPAASSPPPISYLSKAPPCKKREAPESTNKNISIGFLGFPTVLASSSLQMDVILAAASSSQRPPS